MTDLTSAPFNLNFDDLVQVKIRAHNTFGYGSYSSVNTVGARIRRIPNVMTAPTIAAYSDTSITVTWSALTSPANGNSDILAYELRWDNGLGGTPSIELSNVLTTSYVVTGITAGSTYGFIVRARNIYGTASSFSSITTVTAIDAPGKLDIPTVALDTTDNTQVKITWNPPALTHGSAVD